MMLSDLSLWIFGVCAIGFLVGIGLMIKSYRDAKYAAYYFLREEAALRVKRLLFVLVPLAIIVVFLGLRLFGPERQGHVAVNQTPTAPTAATTTGPALVTITATFTGAVTVTGPASTPAPTVQPVTPTAGVTVPVASPALIAAPALTLTAPSTAPVTTGVAPTSPPPITATVESVTPTQSLTTTATISPTATATATPPFSTVTPQPGAEVGPIVFSRAITPDNRPRNPSTVFSPGENYVYAFFDYRNMTNGALWSAVWLKGTEQIGADIAAWPYGSDGRAYIFSAPLGGYQPGKYELRIYVGDQIKQSATFEIQ